MAYKLAEDSSSFTVTLKIDKKTRSLITDDRYHTDNPPAVYDEDVQLVDFTLKESTWQKAVERIINHLTILME